MADAEHLWKTTTRASRRQPEARPAAPLGRAGVGEGAEAETAASAEPHRLVTLAETLDQAGPEFRNVLHTVLVPTAGGPPTRPGDPGRQDTQLDGSGLPGWARWSPASVHARNAR